MNIAEQAFFFLIFLVFARRYSAEVFGELITVFTLANVFITLLNFGLPSYLQKETAFSKDNIGGLYGKIISLNILIFFAYLLLSFSYYRIFYSALSYKLFFVAVMPVYLYSNINILNGLLSGLGKYRAQFKSFIIPRITTLVAFVLSAYAFGLPLKHLLVIYSLGFIYQIILLFVKIGREGIKPVPDFRIDGLLAVLKISLPLGMAVVFNYFYDKIDILLISKFTDYSQVSYYNIGYGIYKASSVAFSFMLVSGLTRVSYLSRRKTAVKIFFRKYTGVFLIAGVCITASLFLLSDFIIKIIYTDKFLPSALILRITSFAVIGLALNNLTGVILNGLSLYRENMYVTFTGLVINVALNIVFIPLYGIIAAAFISVLTEYFIFIGDYYFIKQNLK